MKQIYVAYVDEIPDLTLEPHEICEEITSEDLIKMWYILKDMYQKEKKRKRIK
jgi:hypothetical protein